MLPILWVLAILAVAFGFVVFRGAPYVPTKRRDLARAMGELYTLDDQDLLVDIGSGDGVVLAEAAKRGARAVGYELNPLLVLLSRLRLRKSDRTTVVLADFWRVHFPDDTTVVYVFGDSRDIARMAGKVQDEATRLGRALMFISYAIAVPGVEPIEKAGAHYLYKITPLHPDDA